MDIITYRGEHLTLGTPFSRGAEAELFHTSGGRVVKMFKDGVNLVAKEGKIWHLIRRGVPDSLRDNIAWPIETVYDLTGHFKGYTMRHMGDLRSLPAITTFPAVEDIPLVSDIGYSLQYAVAYYLADIVYRMHEEDLIIGDFNADQVAFLRNGIAPVVFDTDGFHLGDGFLKCVGTVPEYTLPDLLPILNIGFENYDGPTFSECTDDYALAVHIHTLLCNGAHPFNKRGTDLIDNIMMKSPATRGTRQPYYPDGILPKEVECLFERAFSCDVARIPSSKEWCECLERVIKEGFRSTCSNSQHELPREVADRGGTCTLCSAYKRATGHTPTSRDTTPIDWKTIAHTHTAQKQNKGNSGSHGTGSGAQNNPVVQKRTIIDKAVEKVKDIFSKSGGVSEIASKVGWGAMAVMSAHMFYETMVSSTIVNVETWTLCTLMHACMFAMSVASIFSKSEASRFVNAIVMTFATSVAPVTLMIRPIQFILSAALGVTSIVRGVRK